MGKEVYVHAGRVQTVQTQISQITQLHAIRST